MKSSVLVRNNVTVSGRGTQPMLFAHGFGCDQNMWSEMAPAFEDDHRVVLFDYVGSGRSDLAAYDPLRYADLRGYVRDLLDVVEALDLRDVVFVGHSVSATVGLLASIECPERFARMILVCPSACYVNVPPDYAGGFEREDLEGLLDLMDRNYIGWAEFLAPVVMGNPDQPQAVARLRDSFCSTDPTIARRFAEATFFADNRADLPKVTVPCLVLQCSVDAIAPDSAGEFVARNVPRAEFVKLDATGHCPHVSHPAETIQRVREYLAA